MDMRCCGKSWNVGINQINYINGASFLEQKTYTFEPRVEPNCALRENIINEVI